MYNQNVKYILKKGITKNGNLLFPALHIEHYQIFAKLSDCQLQSLVLDSDVIPCSFWLRHRAPVSKTLHFKLRICQ